MAIRLNGQDFPGVRRDYTNYYYGKFNGKFYLKKRLPSGVFWVINENHTSSDDIDEGSIIIRKAGLSLGSDNAIEVPGFITPSNTSITEDNAVFINTTVVDDVHSIESTYLTYNNNYRTPDDGDSFWDIESPKIQSWLPDIYDVFINKPILLAKKITDESIIEEGDIIIYRQNDTMPKEVISITDARGTSYSRDEVHDDWTSWKNQYGGVVFTLKKNPAANQALYNSTLTETIREITPIKSITYGSEPDYVRVPVKISNNITASNYENGDVILYTGGINDGANTTPLNIQVDDALPIPMPYWVAKPHVAEQNQMLVETGALNDPFVTSEFPEWKNTRDVLLLNGTLSDAEIEAIEDDTLIIRLTNKFSQVDQIQVRGSRYTVTHRSEAFTSWQNADGDIVYTSQTNPAVNQIAYSAYSDERKEERGPIEWIHTESPNVIETSTYATSDLSNLMTFNNNDLILYSPEDYYKSEIDTQPMGENDVAVNNEHAINMELESTGMIVESLDRTGLDM